MADGAVRDPTTGTGMGVDSEGRGQVDAKSTNAAEEANANHKSAYVMELPAVTLGSNWIWAAIKNTDDNDMIICRVVLWTTNNKLGDWVAAYTRGAFTYGSNGTAAIPANCNSAGALSADGSFYYNDAVGDMTTITAGQACGKILATTTPQVFSVAPCWIIPKNQTWYLKSELANDNIYQGWIEMFWHANG